MKYGEIKRTWKSIAKFLGSLWLACIIFAGLYFITKISLFGLLMGITFIFAGSLTVVTIVYNAMETGKAVASHKISEHEQSKNICEICEKKGKTAWSSALRVCEDCKKELEG